MNNENKLQARAVANDLIISETQANHILTLLILLQQGLIEFLPRIVGNVEFPKRITQKYLYDNIKHPLPYTKNTNKESILCSFYNFETHMQLFHTLSCHNESLQGCTCRNLS